METREGGCVGEKKTRLYKILGRIVIAPPAFLAATHLSPTASRILDIKEPAFSGYEHPPGPIGSKIEFVVGMYVISAGIDTGLQLLLNYKTGVDLNESLPYFAFTFPALTTAASATFEASQHVYHSLLSKVKKTLLLENEVEGRE